MDFQPKPITKDGIPAALQKAERYRVINDPTSAESICLRQNLVRAGLRSPSSWTCWR